MLSRLWSLRHGSSIDRADAAKEKGGGRRRTAAAVVAREFGRSKAKCLTPRACLRVQNAIRSAGRGSALACHLYSPAIFGTCVRACNRASAAPPVPTGHACPVVRQSTPCHVRYIRLQIGGTCTTQGDISIVYTRPLYTHASGLKLQGTAASKSMVVQLLVDAAGGKNAIFRTLLWLYY